MWTQQTVGIWLCFVFILFCLKDKQAPGVWSCPLCWCDVAEGFFHDGSHWLVFLLPTCKSGILRTLSDETVSMGFGIIMCFSAWEKLLPSSQCLTCLPRLLSVQPLTQRCRFLAQTARQCEREIRCWGDPSACCFLIVDNALLKLFIGSKTLKSAAVSATDLAPELPTLVSCSCLLSYLSVYFNT